jgi:uncharacterized membrane protein YfcA
MLLFGFLIIGLVCGLLAGTLGAGGYSIMMPLLMWSGMSYAEAVAVGLAVNSVPQGAPGLYLYWKKGEWKIRESIAVMIGSTIGVFIGAYAITNYKISQDTLTRILAVSMILIGMGIGFPVIPK